jgi:hypothetical protein
MEDDRSGAGGPSLVDNREGPGMANCPISDDGTRAVADMTTEISHVEQPLSSILRTLRYGQSHHARIGDRPSHVWHVLAFSEA